MTDFMDAYDPGMMLFNANGDGVADAAVVTTETSTAVIETFDLDGDYRPDTALVSEDLNNDGWIDLAYQIDPVYPDSNWQPEPYGVPVETGAGLEHFNPAEQDSDVIGAPAEEMNNWHQQASPDTCAVVSQEFILESLTGQEFSENLMPSKTEQLMKEIRRQPIFRQLIPMEAAVGWPIPLRRDGAVYVTLPFYGYSPTKEKGRTMLYPPLATITLAWLNQKPVEYINLRFLNPQPELKWDAQVGAFPHSAVAGLTVGQYLEKRGELLAMYDEMFETPAGRGGFDAGWTARFGSLLRMLMEPSLEPYYRALAPGSFDRSLAGKHAPLSNAAGVNPQ